MSPHLIREVPATRSARWPRQSTRNSQSKWTTCRGRSCAGRRAGGGPAGCRAARPAGRLGPSSVVGRFLTVRQLARAGPCCTSWSTYLRQYYLVFCVIARCQFRGRGTTRPENASSIKDTVRRYNHQRGFCIQSMFCLGLEYVRFQHT